MMTHSLRERLTLSDGEDESENTCTFDFTRKTWRDDVAFLVEGQRLYASKSVLALVSPVFECMFGEQFAEKYQNEVPLPGKKYADFHEFLKCIYPTSHRPVTEDNVIKLLPLGDEYQVKTLTKKCDKFLCSYLLSKRNIAPSYLLQCHEMATRYRIKDVRDICVSILTEKELEEVQRAKGSLQDGDSFQQVQSDMISKQARDREAVRLELVRLYMNIDTDTNMYMTQIYGYEFAKGATIEFRPSLTGILQKKTQYSFPVRIWDLFFQLQVTHYIQREGEQSMNLILSCKFPSDCVSWMCETKIKILIKEQNDASASRNISRLLTTNYLSTAHPDISYVQELAPFLKSDSGFVRMDKLLIYFHLLANRPYIQ